MFSFLVVTTLQADPISFDRLQSRTQEEVLRKYRETDPRHMSAFSGFQITSDNCPAQLPGKVSKEEIGDTINMLNFYRYLVGLDAQPVTVSKDKVLFNQLLQCAATHLLQHEKDKKLTITNDPIGQRYPCANQDAQAGCQNSLIYANHVQFPLSEGSHITSPAAIIKMMREPANLVQNLQHRRNLLFPQLSQIAFSAAPFFTVIRVTGFPLNNNGAKDIPFIAYPPPGPLPKHYFFNRFSFSLPNNGLNPNDTIQANILPGGKAPTNSVPSLVNGTIYPGVANEMDSTAVFEIPDNLFAQLMSSTFFNVTYTVTPQGQTEQTIYQVNTMTFDANKGKICITADCDPTTQTCPFCPAVFTRYIAPGFNGTTADSASKNWTEAEINDSIPLKTIVANTIQEATTFEPEVFFAGYDTNIINDNAFWTSDMFNKTVKFYGSYSLTGEIPNIGLADKPDQGSITAVGTTSIISVGLFPWKMANKVIQPDVLELDLSSGRSYFQKVASDPTSSILPPKKLRILGQSFIDSISLSANSATIKYDGNINTFEIPLKPFGSQVKLLTDTVISDLEVVVTGSNIVNVDVQDGVTKIPGLSVNFQDGDPESRIITGGNWNNVENKDSLRVEGGTVETSTTKKPSPNVGLIVGVVVAVVVVIAIVAAVLVVVIFKKRQNAKGEGEIDRA